MAITRGQWALGGLRPDVVFKTGCQEVPRRRVSLASVNVKCAGDLSSRYIYFCKCLPLLTGEIFPALMIGN